MSEVRQLLGVYDADGTLRGEVAYVVGHLLGRRHCGLCDITHGSLRRKPAWDAMVRRVGLPFRLLHRDELDQSEREAVANVGLPVVLASTPNGWTELMGADELDRLGGDVDQFEIRLRELLEQARGG